MCWHRWTRWQAYQLDSVIARILAGVTLAEAPSCEVRERRSCEKCGTTQDRRIRNGPMWKQEGR